MHGVGCIIRAAPGEWKEKVRTIHSQVGEDWNRFAEQLQILFQSGKVFNAQGVVTTNVTAGRSPWTSARSGPGSRRT